MSSCSNSFKLVLAKSSVFPQLSVASLQRLPREEQDHIGQKQPKFVVFGLAFCFCRTRVELLAGYLCLWVYAVHSVMSVFSAEHFWVSRRKGSGESRWVLPALLRERICVCLFKNCQCQQHFFFILLLKTMSWTSSSPVTKKEIVQFWTLCWSCTARSLPGLWHYQQKMLLLKEPECSLGRAVVVGGYQGW